MAQDFGDDIGDELLRAVKLPLERALMNYIYRKMADTVKNTMSKDMQSDARKWYKAHGESASEAKKLSARESVTVPFGDSADASYFAQVCRTTGIYAAPLSDGKGNGFVQFFKDDSKEVMACTERFAAVMAELKCSQITEQLNKAKPLPQTAIQSLKPIKKLPDLPLPTATEHGVAQESPMRTAPAASSRPVDDKARDAYNHTLGIRDTVLAAREQCTDLEDFKGILAKDSIGVTLAADGGIKLYEARLDEQGNMLPFDKALDWPVNAKTLAEKYECDVTAEWFEKNTPKSPSGPIPPSPDLICNAVRGDLEEKGIQTLDRPDGKMGFIVDRKYKQDVADAVEARFPGHAPEELGIEFDNGRGDPPNPPTPPVIDGSLDMDGRTPDLNQGIESHDGADTATATARIEREQVNSDVAPSAVRESSGGGKGYDFKSTAQESRDGSKQLEKESGANDRDIDISDKFDRNR